MEIKRDKYLSNIIESKNDGLIKKTIEDYHSPLIRKWSLLLFYSIV